MKQFPLYITILLLLSLELQAQEPNFSMYHYSPFFTNPGEFGAEVDVRVLLNYRNQAIDLDKNFSTSSFSVFYPIYIGKNRLVAAANLLNDRSSDILSTNGGMMGLAYSVQTTTNSALSLGIQAGYFQRAPGSNYTTDDQYVDGVFNPGAVSGDAVLQARKAYPAFSGGLYYKVMDDAGLEKAFIGTSIFNINRPNVSLFNDQNDLPMVFKSTVGYRVYHNMNVSVIPTARWVGHAGNHFVNIGSRFGYELNNKGNESKKIELGVWYHTNQLGVFSMAYEQSNFTIAASYDQSIGSELGNVQNSIFELAISLRLQKKNKPSTTKTGQLSIEPVESKEKEVAEEVAAPKTAEAVQEPSLPNTNDDGDTVNNELSKEKAEPETGQISLDTNSGESLTATEKAVLAKTIMFDFNSENLDSGSQLFLDEVASILEKKKNFNIELVGHSCNLGPENVNRELSLKRAVIVKEYLVNRGVDKDRFTVIGMGESEPLADNSTQEGREHNRRVAFNVVY